MLVDVWSLLLTPVVIAVLVMSLLVGVIMFVSGSEGATKTGVKASLIAVLLIIIATSVISFVYYKSEATKCKYDSDPGAKCYDPTPPEEGEW